MGHTLVLLVQTYGTSLGHDCSTRDELYMRAMMTVKWLAGMPLLLPGAELSQHASECDRPGCEWSGARRRELSSTRMPRAL